MKKLIEDNEEGLLALIGQRVLVMTAGYFYEGKLVGVNSSCIKLNDTGIVYETGKFSDIGYRDLQKLHTSDWYVSTGLIESFGVSKND